jgi:hypothetical protein
VKQWWRTRFFALAIIALGLYGCVARIRLAGIREYSGGLDSCREAPFDGEVAPADYLVREGDRIRLKVLEPSAKPATPPTPKAFQVTLRAKVKDQLIEKLSPRGSTLALSIPAYVLDTLLALKVTSEIGTWTVQLDNFDVGKSTWRELQAMFSNASVTAELAIDEAVPVLPGDELRLVRIYGVDYSDNPSEHLEEVTVRVDASGFIEIPQPRLPQLSSDDNTPLYRDWLGGIEASNFSIRVWKPRRKCSEHPSLVALERCLNALTAHETSQPPAQCHGLEIDGAFVMKTSDKFVRYRVVPARQTWTLVTETGARVTTPWIPGENLEDAVKEAYRGARGRELLHEGYAFLTVVPRAAEQINAFYWAVHPESPRSRVRLLPGDTVLVTHYRPEQED